MVSSHPASRASLTRLMAAVAAITFGVAVLALDARATYGARVTADEPQYLLTSLSLAEDVDLDISDEIATERFRRFHEVSLNPQTIDLNGSGQRISPHDPLLPLLLAPAMGVGGWVGAKLTLAALAAMTAAATTWLAVRRFGVSKATAGMVCTALFVAPPLTSYATQVYPEMPAALAVVVGVAAVTGRRSPLAQAVAVVAVLVLPWLAIKYVPIAIVLAAGLLLPMLSAGDQKLRALGVTTVLGLAGLTYLLIHQRVWGGWTVYASGDHFVDGEFQVVGRDPDYVGRSRRLVGLLFDRRFGLVAWAPVYLGLVPAITMAVRRRMPGWRVAVGVIGVGWAVATWVALTMHGWWWPGRQVVVVLPVGVAMMAAAVDGRPRLLSGLLTASLLGTASWLWLAFEASTGRRTLIVDFQDTTFPWYQVWSRALPDHSTFGVGDVLLTGAWTAATIGLSVLAWRSARDYPLISAGSVDDSAMANGD